MAPTPTRPAWKAPRLCGDAGDPYCLRSPDTIARFFDGLDLLEPGVVSIPRWRPDSGTMDDHAELAVFLNSADLPDASGFGAYHHPLAGG